jgi:hypothetical protein
MIEDIVNPHPKPAEIRRQIPTRKSVIEGQPDRLADLLDEAGDEIDKLKADRLLGVLESILPYVEHAAKQKLHNAQYYLEVIDSLLWRDVAKVRLDQCGIPKCKGCGMHLNHEHAEGCLIVLSEEFKRRSKCSVRTDKNKGL